MATNYAFTEGVKLTIKNIWEAPADFAGDQVWNTGLAAANEPHFDEADVAGDALTPDAYAFETAHDAQIRLFKTNQAIVLKPGDTFVIEPKTAAEYLYYKELGSDFIEVSEEVPEEVSEGTDA